MREYIVGGRFTVVFESTLPKNDDIDDFLVESLEPNLYSVLAVEHSQLR